ncbi:DUF2793 domain-containing protein [Actibacterium sp. MT2.3-13A]|uniref:DUF2793 domain-containing protein n=1 Tax=Actibacterium sp. MT2.3-13A TaxID=2828332 RepID=UPI001BA5A967|nr:DUF2793 domain-containing protein [Actibacterium sp. MT2.3-13A]
MPDTSARLSLPLLMPSQAQKHVTHNEALLRLDLLVQLAVEAFGASTPPVSPQEGQVWALGAAPVGDWAGHADELAAWVEGAWAFIAPRPGWRAADKAGQALRLWTGAAWDLPTLSGLDGIGVQTGYDATNRLAVAAPATLFTHEGADHRMKINKAAGADTASLLFQTGWSGRAEMGTAGSDDFSIRLSADGTAWVTGLRLEAATGRASLPGGLEVTGQVTGDAVQQAATDTTAGRLARADHVYGPGNLLGTASQSAGTPTGAVIERGSNANGDYVRLADGTQICWVSKTTAYISGSYCAANWTFPAAFAAPPVSQITLAGDSWGTDVPSGLSRGDATPVRGNNTATALSAQVWARSGTAFGAADAPKLDCHALGRWF